MEYDKGLSFQCNDYISQILFPHKNTIIFLIRWKRYIEFAHVDKHIVIITIKGMPEEYQ